MTSRTRVKRWMPTFGEALRLAWRPALAYSLFAHVGVLVMVITFGIYKGGDEEYGAFIFGAFVGTIGTILGQIVALLRLRAFPVLIITAISMAAVIWVIDSTSPNVGAWVGFPVLFFCMGFPCGVLSLMHRYELFASFYPAFGWIGSVFFILNKESRVDVWEQSKIRAWLPVPLAMLAGFLVFWLFFLAAKQAVRVELWQALSGAAQRRIAKAQKKNRVGAVPRKNILPLLVVGIFLFAGVAALSPYLWRTGKGDHGATTTTEPSHDPPIKGPELDAEGLLKELQKLANAAKNTLPKLWPLLLLIVFYRPTKRALLLAHLKAPLVPTPPSERIDNLWEYVRIAAEDAGVVPASADSIESIVRRIEGVDRASPALYEAAAIYARTRYGFVVQRGDAVTMRTVALEAAGVLKKNRGAWPTVTAWFRPLS